MRDKIVSLLNDELKIDKIKDDSKNGLQIQGTPNVKKIGLVVDASLQAYHEAIARNCQMLIAHHGIIWGNLGCINGNLYEHVKYCINNELNLYASHLPLDLHPQYGNNIQLAEILNLEDILPFGTYKGEIIGFEGVCKDITVDNLELFLSERLGGPCVKLPFGPKSISRIAIISGGGAQELHEAIAKGVDCFITGESSHWCHHTALESHINVLFCGHYHTETLGVKAIGKFLEEKFSVQTEFIDIPTIV